MWIMLTKKLPTEVSPPKLSIFWSKPWEVSKTEIKEVRRKLIDKYSADAWYKGLKKISKKEMNEVLEMDAIPGLYGMEPNPLLARKILYKDEQIKVYPHEFSAVSKKNMLAYVEGGCHELITSSVAEDTFIKEIFKGELKPIMEAAKLDGCTDAQSVMIAIGMDITIDDVEFPAIGWYKCRPEYASYYCYDDEMEG